MTETGNPIGKVLLLVYKVSPKNEIIQESCA